MTNRPDQYGEPVVRVITFNLEHDGGPDKGGQPPQRWQDAHELLRDRRPDILLRQEMTYSRAEGGRRLHAAERALGMRGFLGAPGSGRNGTGLFVRPTTFEVHQQFDDNRIWRTPPTNTIVRLPEAPDRNIVLASWHAAFNSPRGREREAEEISALADKMKQGSAFIGGGDCNEYPHPAGETVPPIDWTSPDVTDYAHVVHRTNPGPNGSRISCTYLDETLLRCGLHDPARYAADSLGQGSALQATAGHAAKGQGGGRRIDRLYLDPWTITAVLDVSVIDTTGISDHHAVEVVLSYRGLVEALRRTVDPRPPHVVAA
ncbi:endonuclease/exonuclease/phosphatase family protein [Streptomyces sp. GbtcB6]|uniref:endonuclease/exonuclease/phosphatase family protein n=1 Tax=Streptomyces sp. GbtcB6 TaxID=2824751 RepID=UPI001C2F6613|nr:endonuclease/exonuclease/phosphatase family protein [Streptomyces sp. GbtcB6]